MEILSKKNLDKTNDVLKGLDLPLVGADDKEEQRAARLAWNAWDVASGTNLLAFLVPILLTVLASDNKIAFYWSGGIALVAILIHMGIYFSSASREMAQAVIDLRKEKERETNNDRFRRAQPRRGLEACESRR